MQLAVFGAGNVGGTLGKGWARAGHSVTFGVRNPLDPKVQSLLADIGANAEAKTIGVAAKAPVVVLCIPWQAAQETIRAAGNLKDKIVIDATNPMAMTLDGLREGLVIGHRTSAAEQVAQWTPEAHVVKAF